MTKEGFIGQFVIDSTIRNSPSFHFGVKHKEKLTTAQLTPGPAAYFPENKTYNTGREANRAPLIVSRKSPFKAPKNPGPADYLPGSCALLSQHPSTPSFSIPRASHIPEKKSKTPGDE